MCSRKPCSVTYPPKLEYPRIIRSGRPGGAAFPQGKGKVAKLCFMGHVLLENRHGLIITPRLTATAYNLVRIRNLTAAVSPGTATDPDNR